MNQIQIGNQIWTSENINVTIFRNGDTIPFVENNADWSSLSSPAYCITDNGVYLYNYWVIIDPRNVAPIGWKIPSESDWDILINFIGHKDIAGYKLKSISGWIETLINPNTGEYEINYANGTDEYGFNGYPVGFRHQNGDFLDHLLSAFFLPESIDGELAKYIFLFSGDEFAKGGMWKRDGFPIRLIKE